MQVAPDAFGTPGKRGIPLPADLPAVLGAAQDRPVGEGLRLVDALAGTHTARVSAPCFRTRGSAIRQFLLP